MGDYRVLDGPVGRGDTDWAGDVLSLHIGADTRVRPDLLTGVALSRSTSAFEFSNRTGPSVVTGDYEADVTSVHPYAAWFAGERSLAVWTTVGYGGGGVSIEESTGDMRSGDTRFLTAAAGGSAIVLSAGAASLRAKSEAWMTRVDVEENSQMDALDVDMRRARLAVEGNRAFSFDSGDELSLALETGLRYDGGDGAKSGALELGGGVRYARPSLGLVAEGRGRIMATRQDGYREWGFSGRIQIDTQTLGEGLALAAGSVLGRRVGRCAATVGSRRDGRRGERLPRQGPARLLERRNRVRATVVRRYSLRKLPSGGAWNPDLQHRGALPGRHARQPLPRSVPPGRRIGTRDPGADLQGTVASAISRAPLSPRIHRRLARKSVVR